MKLKRLFVVVIILLSSSLLTIFALSSLSENVSLFYTPSEIDEKAIGKEIKIGGEITDIISNGNFVIFRIFDEKKSVAISYKGTLPPLFGKTPAIVTGIMINEEKMEASNVVSKHDEIYYPKSDSYGNRTHVTTVKGWSPDR